MRPPGVGNAARLTGILTATLVLVPTTARAHVGALGGAGDPGPVPLWLIVLTGGAIVAASFLFTAFITERRDIDAISNLAVAVRVPRPLARLGRVLGPITGVIGLVVVVASGFLGPSDPVRNLGILVVWVGWWAGYTMSVYLVGNTWPLLNPWRAIADRLPRLDRSYPASLGAWPAVLGLLALVSVEVVSPLATSPRLLAVVVLLYSLVTLAGAVTIGPDTWFRTVDPVSKVFRLYGRLAPVGRQASRDGRPDLETNGSGASSRLLSLGWPGVRLCRPGGTIPSDETAFVVALLWATTFDGLVSTPAWAALARAIVGFGVPPLALYLGAMAIGFGVFLRVYRAASRHARSTSDTYITGRFLGGWFALALLPIAAGYHLAHFLSYFLRLAPALVQRLATPLTAPATVSLPVIPAWFGVLELAFVVGGHLLAVWIAHAASFRLFPGALTPLRSQYPFVIAMVGYTVVSMWIIAQPYVPPPYV